MARLMSETFGTRHHEYEIDGTETSALPTLSVFWVSLLWKAG